MRYAAIAFVLLAETCVAASFQAAFSRAVVVSDREIAITYEFSFPERNENAGVSTVSIFNASKQYWINLPPKTAEDIISKIEELQRKRIFHVSETVAENIFVTLGDDGKEMSLRVFVEGEMKEASIRGDSMTKFIENCRNASEVASSWMFDLLKQKKSPPSIVGFDGLSYDALFALIGILAVVCLFLWLKLSKSWKQIQEIAAERSRIVNELQDKNNEIEIARTNAWKDMEQANAALEDMKNVLQKVQEKAREDAFIFAEVIANFVRFKGEGIAPPSCIADELEIEYGFSRPGQVLSEARKESKKLIKQKLAAVCKDRDENFRNEACVFIVDVFNHYFESIIKNATHDNYDSIFPKVREAYEVVNARCRALIDTSISTEYYQARTKELKALYVVLGLRERDRAEQREIREQMRDEEKARREAEKMLRESAKIKAENERKESEIQTRLDLATGFERERYEAILADLRSKIKEQEERELQAKSLAEFTRRGHVYVISNIGSFGEDVLKIGMTRRLIPEDRVTELGAASVPFPFDIHAMIPTEDAPRLESEFHAEFNERMLNKVNTRKEFFKVSLDEIRRFLDNVGIDLRAAKFTMKAEARQYRESQAIDALPRNQRERELQRILEKNRADDSYSDDEDVGTEP